MATDVGTLQAGLSLDIQAFAAGIKEATTMVKSLGKMLNEALGDTRGLSAMQKSMSETKASVEGVKAAAATMSAELNNASKATTGFRSIQQYTSRIKDNLGKFASPLKSANSSAKGLNTNMAGVAPSARNAESAVDRIAKNLQKSTEWATDLKRIIRGIVISQTFYQLLNVMEELVAGSWQFMNNMDQAQISFSYILGSQEKASAFVQTMQDFAISSPLNTQSVMDATRKLMAMGFSAKAAVPAMQVLTDTAAVFTSEAGGMSDMIDHVTLAIGQMKASGKVMGQELRQLYNAGIPVFKILQEELGLTADQIRNIGNENISADRAIVALLTGLQKHYEGAAEAFTKTIPGALEVIKDSAYVINSILFKDIQEGVKGLLNNVATQLSVLVRIIRVYGSGGLFQALFPPELQMALRNIMGSMHQLGVAIHYVGLMFREVFGTALSFIVQALAVILPPITSLVNALAQVAYTALMTIPGLKTLLGLLMGYKIVMMSAAAFMFLWKTLKLGAICAGVAAMIRGLVKVILAATIATRGWAIALIFLLGILAMLAMKSDRAKSALQGLYDSLMNSNKTGSANLDIGFDPNDVAQPKFDPPTSDVDDYNAALEDTADGMDDVADKTKKANKSQKNFIQSFDEVYNMRDESSNDTGASLDEQAAQLGNFDDALQAMMDKVQGFNWTGDFWKDLKGVKLDEGLIDMDTSGFADMSNKFWSELVKAFSAPPWVGMGLGALIGGAIGLLLGSPLVGAAIGSVVGWIAGLFWPELKEAFGLSGAQVVGASIGASLGIIIGGLIGGPAGAAIGAGIGALVGGLIGLLVDGFKNGNWNIPGLSLTIGTALGAAIGMVVGGPVGAAIGAAIGALVGWIVGKISENWDAICDTMAEWAVAIGNFFTEDIPNAIVDMYKWFEELPYNIGYWLGQTAAKFVLWVQDSYKSFIQFKNDCIESLKQWFADLPANIKASLDNIVNKFEEWKANMKNWFDTKLPALIDDLVSWFENIPDKLKEIGGFMLEGLWNGIFNKKQWLLDQIAELSSGFVDGFKEALGIHSPSTEMMPVGQYMIEGLEKGMQGSAGGALSAASSISQQLVNAMFNNAGTSGNSFAGLTAESLQTLQKWTDDITALLAPWLDKMNLMFDSWETATLKGFTDWAKGVFTSIDTYVAMSIQRIQDLIAAQSMLSDSSMSTTTKTATTKLATSSPLSGHATGGIFDREHVANFAEGNKAEMVVPLENNSAMAPFVDAIAQGIVEGILPTLVAMKSDSSDDSLRPLVVGTLVADDAGLKQLERKMYKIRQVEEARR